MVSTLMKSETMFVQQAQTLGENAGSLWDMPKEPHITAQQAQMLREDESSQPESLWDVSKEPIIAPQQAQMLGEDASSKPGSLWDVPKEPIIAPQQVQMLGEDESSQPGSLWTLPKEPAIVPEQAQILEDDESSQPGSLWDIKEGCVGVPQEHLLLSQAFPSQSQRKKGHYSTIVGNEREPKTQRIARSRKKLLELELSTLINRKLIMKTTITKSDSKYLVATMYIFL